MDRIGDSDGVVESSDWAGRLHDANSQDVAVGRRLWQPSVWWTTGVPILLMLLFATVAIYLSVRRYDTLNTGFRDPGRYTQIVWNLAHGRWFVWSDTPPNYLGDHFSPLLAVLAPLFWFAPDTRTLEVVGMLAVTCSVLPAYLILRAKHPLLGPLLVLSLVLNPFLHTAAREDIHTIFLAAPTVGIAVYALYRSRYGLMVAALAATLLIREDMPLYVGSFGLFLLLFRPGQRRLGFAIGTVAAVWLVATTLVIMPALNSGSYRHSDQTQGMLSTLVSTAATLAAEPQNALSLFLTSKFAQNLATFLVPLAALPLLAGEYALLWFPPLLILLLSPEEATYFSFGYGWRLAPLLPLWFACTAIVVSRLGRHRALLAVLILTACALVSFRAWSQFPGGERFLPSAYEAGVRTEALKAVLRRVPPDMAVAATNRLAAQLGTREHIYLFPFFSTQEPPDIALVDASGEDLFPFNTAEELQAAVEALRRDTAVKAVWREDDILVFSFTDNTPFPNNYGVPMYYYQVALEKARALLGGTPGSTVYLRSAADVADRVQALGQESGLETRVSTSPNGLLLGQDAGGDHLYVVPSDDTAAVEQLQALGFVELPEERITLPGGLQSLGFYRLHGLARERLATTLPQVGPDLRLSNGLRLWRWQGPGDARGQRVLPLTLAWEVWDQPTPLGKDLDFCTSQHLLDVAGKSLAVADTQFEPTRFLRQGDLVVTWPQLPLADSVDLQQAWVEAGMFGCWQRETAAALDAGGNVVSGGVRIGPFKIGALAASAQAAPPKYPVQAKLGDAIRLAGYDASAETSGGKTAIRVQLHWYAESRPAADYTVFVQLLRDGKVVAQQDNQPRGGRYPTSVWDEGETVLDSYTLTSASALAPGDYRLIAGMYTPADVRRLAVQQAGGIPPADFVDFGTVTVVPDGGLKITQPRN